MDLPDIAGMRRARSDSVLQKNQRELRFAFAGSIDQLNSPFETRRHSGHS